MVDVRCWWFGVLPYWLYQRKMPEDDTGKADVDRCDCDYCIGICMWLHRESMAWLECMGLQQHAFQFTWSDMLTIYRNMVFLIGSGGCLGRLDKTYIVGRRYTTLQMEVAHESIKFLR